MIRIILAVSLVFLLQGCSHKMGGGGDVVSNGMMPEEYSASSTCDCKQPNQPLACGCEAPKKKKPHAH